MRSNYQTAEQTNQPIKLSSMMVLIAQAEQLLQTLQTLDEARRRFGFDMELEFKDISEMLNKAERDLRADAFDLIIDSETVVTRTGEQLLDD